MHRNTTWKTTWLIGTTLVLLVTIFFTLGIWQINRAAWKQQLIRQLQTKMISPPINLNREFNLTSNKADLTFTPVRATGHWLADKYFLLDNQIVDKQVGFRVIMPFVLKNKLLLIDRGFVAYGKNRSSLLNIVTTTNLTTLTGIIYQQPTGKLLKADVYDNTNTWPKIIQAIDFALLAKFLNVPMHEFIVRLDKHDHFAFTQPEITFGLPVSKHFGYAVQWFSLSALATIYGLVLLWRFRIK